jgi:hypothetical protein
MGNACLDKIARSRQERKMAPPLVNVLLVVTIIIMDSYLTHLITGFSFPRGCQEINHDSNRVSKASSPVMVAG